MHPKDVGPMMMLLVTWASGHPSSHSQSLSYYPWNPTTGFTARVKDHLIPAMCQQALLLGDTQCLLVWPGLTIPELEELGGSPLLPLLGGCQEARPLYLIAHSPGMVPRACSWNFCFSKLRWPWFPIIGGCDRAHSSFISLFQGLLTLWMRWKKHALWQDATYPQGWRPS